VEVRLDKTLFWLKKQMNGLQERGDGFLAILQGEKKHK
jgi:hypothetical protein